MSYKIVEKTKDKIILSREKIFMKVFFLILFGSIFVGVGLLVGLLAMDQNNDPIVTKIPFIFSGAGLLVIIMALYLPRSHRKRLPEQVVFDNTKGIVKIINDTKTMEYSDAYIRYDEIEKFDIRQESHSSSSNGRSRTYYTYHAIILKKDSGTFEFYDSTTQTKVEDFIKQITETVDLKQSTSHDLKPEFPNNIKKEVRADKVYVRWENPFNFALIPVLLFISYIVFFFYTILTSIEDIPTPAYIIIGIIATVFAVAIGFYIRNLIKDATTIYGFSISKQNFEYFEEDKNGTVRTSSKVPLDQLYSITFNLKVSSTDDSIIIYTKDNFNKQNDLKNTELSLSNIKEAISLYKEQISLNTKGLTTVEKIQLEYWIQEVIKEKSTLQVL